MRGIINYAVLLGIAVLLFSWSVILYPHLYDPLRSFGIPIPYCFTEKLAISCRYTTNPLPTNYDTVLSSHEVYVALPYAPDADLLNKLCNRAKAGYNVLALVDVYPDLNNIVDSLSACGVRVRRYPVDDMVIVSPTGLILRTDFGTLFTDCNDVVNAYMQGMLRRWQNAEVP